LQNAPDNGWGLNNFKNINGASVGLSFAFRFDPLALQNVRTLEILQHVGDTITLNYLHRFNNPFFYLKMKIPPFGEDSPR